MSSSLDNTAMPGTCVICGCTELTPCVFETADELVPCGWANETQTLCDNQECLIQYQFVLSSLVKQFIHKLPAEDESFRPALIIAP